MLNNITNFFNLIKTGKVKTQLDATDLLPIGTRDLRFSGQYQPTMIKYGDFISGLVGGSNGQVLFNDNDTIAGASTFYWDKVNNRVGIGTSTPTNTLDINGTARVSGNTLLDSGIIATSLGTTRLQSSLNFFSHQRLASSGAFGFDIRNSAATQCALWTYDAGSGNINFGGSTSAGALLLSTNNAERLRIFQTTGNVAINTTTDAGFTLDVNGATRVTGIGTTSATTSFQVVNSVGLVPFRILGNGDVEMPFRASLQFDFTCRGISTNGGYGTQGLRLSSQNYGNAAGSAVTINYSGSPAGVTSNGLVIGGSSLQSATYNNIVVGGDFSSSIGTNTIVGYLFNPTLNGTFSSANTIAIHTVTGNVLLGTTSGNVGIGTTSPATKLHVSGSIPVVSNLAQGVLFNNTITATSASDILVGLDINPTFGGNNSSNWHTLRLWQPLDQYGDNRPYLSWRYGNSGGSQFDVFRMFMDAGWKVNFKSTGAQPGFIFTGGNLMINTTTDAGFRFDVNGTARVSGTGNVFTINETSNSRNFTFNPSYATSSYGGFITHSLGHITLGANLGTDNGSALGIFLGGVSANRNASALLQMDSTNRGFLPPRMTTTEKNAISGPAAGLMIYDTTLNRPCFYNGTTWITL